MQSGTSVTLRGFACARSGQSACSAMATIAIQVEIGVRHRIPGRLLFRKGAIEFGA
ncbi:MAG TPA: hypothetical protein VEB41_12670 [Burkholderiales bacterium]|nr:hypothetical protein [Burkholderiales bacterium]